MGGPAPSNMQMPGVLAQLKGAELFIAAGAALIVVVDLVFNVFGPFGISNTMWAAAVIALLLIFMSSRMFGLAAGTVRSLLLLIGAYALIGGVRDLLFDIQFLNGANVATTFFLGMIGYYAGVALLVFGAWTLWKSKAA